MYMVTLSQRQPHRQTWVDAHRRAIADIKIPATEVPSNCSGFLLCKRSWPLAGTERGCGGTSQGAVVIARQARLTDGALAGRCARRSRGLKVLLGVAGLLLELVPEEKTKATVSSEVSFLAAPAETVLGIPRFSHSASDSGNTGYSFTGPYTASSPSPVCLHANNMAHSYPNQSPAPFADFDFSFDPALQNLFPPPPPLPPSAGLFSPSETTDLFGFLDNFNFDVEGTDALFVENGPAHGYGAFLEPPYPNNVPPTSPFGGHSTSRVATDLESYYSNHRDQPPRRSSSHSVTPPASASVASSPSNHHAQANPRAKTLLSSPQKRLNHIMSEQKRRNAIRDGYAQLIALLAPEGSSVAIGMPTRGRPKGSGNRAKGRSQGKSGVLFRAVEYCKFLEEGSDALRAEVLRLEAAAAWPIPEFDLKVEDLTHPGATLFFDAVKPTEALQEAALSVFKWLYTQETAPQNVQTVLLVLKPMEGVAYTFGSDKDKQIHMSLDHIVNSADRATAEIMGVLTHEMVHCFQYNGKGKCPGGMIEGVADWVRLNANLAPPHWKREPAVRWDAGYQHTAYFLNWIEERYGPGKIRKLNETMKTKEYNDEIFHAATGQKLKRLWKLYCS
ncbi:BSP-domain-containing protein [Neolentinus lepideus HHB14362 ss-1]|uniref:BSP-domain-containing protein n=1 Tax=Neolentinus lepideus HHB14362 ss-1 TaxID=1314782 RepID=A0A165WAY9_9AGAM|nr:BSP-domain-containing protein [Neolentinus lepideus HHB14362 ss-1]